jgi:hypothetical protein
MKGALPSSNPRRRRLIPARATNAKRQRLFGAITFWWLALHFVLQHLTFLVIHEQIWYLSWTFVGFALIFIASGAYRNLSRNPRGLFLLLAVPFSMVLALILQALYGENLYDQFDRSSRDAARAVFVTGMGWLVAGGLLQSARLPRSLLIILIPYAIALVCIGLNLDGGFAVEYSSVKYRSEDFLPDHLGLTTGFSFLALSAYAVVAGRWKVIVALSALFGLLALGGRATLYLFLGTIFIGFLVSADRRKGVFIFGTLAAIGLWLLSIFAERNENLQRMWIFGNFEQDGSVRGRSDSFNAALDPSLEQLAYGAPQALVHDFNNLGAYSHNLLSVVQFYGLIPFVLLLTASLLSLHHALSYYARSKNPINVLGVHLIILVTLEVTFAKSVHYSLFWLGLGFWLFRISSSTRHRNHAFISSKLNNRLSRSRP